MRESNRLSTMFVKQAKTPGVYRDGGGLLLRIEPSGSRRWVLRTTVKGKRRDVGLGSARDVGLAEAREMATELRKVARAGQNPVAARREARGERLSFAAAAEAVHAQRAAGWRNGKHVDQWLASLREYAFPAIGAKPVGDIESADVLKVLAPIWLTKGETARRVRQRIRVVLDWAVAAGHRSSNTVNAADPVKAGLPRQSRRVRHFPAVPWGELPRLLARLRGMTNAEAVRFALEFMILTAGRTSEVLGARWTEIDVEAAIWTVPATRMKAQREHRVPLSPQALRILSECRLLWPKSEVVFPGRSADGTLSNMALLMLMRRLGRTEVPHGFRSSFRDWAADTGKNRDVAEAALAHLLQDRTEAAYRRSDLLDARRALMQEWANFLSLPSE
jgi:integrase